MSETFNTNCSPSNPSCVPSKNRVTVWLAPRQRSHRPDVSAWEMLFRMDFYLLLLGFEHEVGGVEGGLQG